MFGLPILSVIVLLPLLGALLIAVLPSTDPDLIRRTALGTALATWVLSLLLLVTFAVGLIVIAAGYLYLAVR
jgi:NADH:ubiquinone oxidoreductase subunit 4 (subunit M)